jgi:hypothetical protein
MLLDLSVGACVRVGCWLDEVVEKSNDKKRPAGLIYRLSQRHLP